MMPRVGDQVLLPVNGWFMWGSMGVALILNMVPLGRLPALPDIVLLVLVFWNVHQPRRVGVGAAFVFGLLMDVHESALLGQHALAYTLLSFLAITIHRRLLWFTAPAQALHVLPLLFGSHLVTLLLRLATGGDLPGWPWLLAPLFEAMLWPVISLVLLAPQRRAPDPDKHRPL